MSKKTERSPSHWLGYLFIFKKKLVCAHFKEEKSFHNEMFWVFFPKKPSCFISHWFFFKHSLMCDPHNFHILQTTCLAPFQIQFWDSMTSLELLLCLLKMVIVNTFKVWHIYFIPKKSQTEPCLCKTFTTKIANKEICCCFRRAKSCAVFEFYVIINVQIDKRGLSWLRLTVSKCIRNIVRYCSIFEDTLSYQINWFVVLMSTDSPGLY